MLRLDPNAHPNIEAETPPKIPIDCVIEDCIVEQPSLNNVRETTCINMSAAEPLTGDYAGIMAYHDACVVRRCLVNCEFQVNPMPIKAISFSGSTATAETWVPHGRQNGQWVRVAGAVLNGSTINSYNGSFVISNVTATTFSYTMASSPSVSPTGEMWLDRFPSHRSQITNLTMTPSGAGEYTVTVTTLLPHWLVEGESVVVNNVLTGSPPGTDQNAYNGTFSLVSGSITNANTFWYKIQSDPGTPNYSGAFLGVRFQAISNDGGTGAVVELNKVLHTAVGVYHDFYRSLDLTVRDNVFIDVECAVQQQLGQFSSVLRAASSLTQSGLPSLLATFTTERDHGLRVGDGVEIVNADPVGFRGSYEVASVNATDPKVFSYVLRADPGASSASNASFIVVLTTSS